MGQFLRAELAAGRGYLPAGDDVFKAFRRPLADVRVLIVGQDPYPTPGHPIGLSFAVAPDVRPLPAVAAQHLPGAVDRPRRRAGRRTATSPPWADQGVMLLNRVLTVRPGESASHRGRGWEEVTSCAIDALVRRGGPAAAILWGRDAQSLKPALGADPVGRVGAPVAAVGGARLLRVPAVLPGQPAAASSRAARRSTGRCRHDPPGAPASADDPWPGPVMTAGAARTDTGAPGPGTTGGRTTLSRNKVEYAIIWSVMNDRMPALYIGHGAPPLLDDPLWSSQLSDLAADLPRPKAILIVSAHWESAPVMLQRRRRAAGLRLRRLRGEVLPDDLRDPGRHRAGPAGRGDDAGHRAGAPAPQPRPRPRRVGAAEDHVPRRPTSRCCRCRCRPPTPPGCSPSASGCGRCATRAC